MIVWQYESSVDQPTDPNSFSTCMMNASTFLLVISGVSDFFDCSTSSMYSKELRTTCLNLQRYTEHMIIPKPLPNSGEVLSMTKSSYRKTYIPLTELKTRTSLQYHYSWNTCENHLAVPVGPAKTYENFHHKGQNQIACKKPYVLWSSHSMHQMKIN